MKFEEALALHRKGKKVRLPWWCLDKSFSEDFSLNYKDVISNEWQLSPVLTYDQLEVGEKFTFEGQSVSIAFFTKITDNNGLRFKRHERPYLSNLHNLHCNTDADFEVTRYKE